MTLFTRRQFVASAPAALAATPWLSACDQGLEADGYDATAARLWQPSPTADLQGLALGRELVRCATLAPSSHNTQCWQFVLAGDGRSVTLLPDVTRRCPAVDPDDHHLWVSLGCATENLVQAALAHGLHAEAGFDAAAQAVRVTLTPTPAQATPLFAAIPQRQSTRDDYDGRPLTNTELALLQQAGGSDAVRLLLITDPPAMARVLDATVQANTAQIADPAFVTELKSWVRFNASAAVRSGDGLYSACSGNPNLPTWLGDRAFGWFFTPKGENDKLARQWRRSAGAAVFVAQVDDKAHWLDVGRCCQRLALQATALGIRCAFVNQAVEVAALRPALASAIGLSGQRPDLVMRFGRGPAMPRSLRRPVDAVLRM